MKRFIQFLFVVAGISLSVWEVSAEITPLEKWEQVDEAIEVYLAGEPHTRKPEEILIVLSVEEVILESKEDAVRCRYSSEHREIFNELIKDLDAGQKDRILTESLQGGAERVKDPKLLLALKRWQKKGCKVIAFTQTLTNPASSIEDKLLFKRRDRLQQYGFDFTKAFKIVVPFSAFARYEGDYPTFYFGVFSLNGSSVPLGKALRAFLEHVGPATACKLAPFGGKGHDVNKLILISKESINLEDVEQELRRPPEPTATTPCHLFLGYKGELLGLVVAEEPSACDSGEISPEDFKNFWIKQLSKLRQR